MRPVGNTTCIIWLYPDIGTRGTRPRADKNKTIITLFGYCMQSRGIGYT